MPAQPQPTPQGGVDPFADHINRHNYIPVWLHPHVAAGVIRHFGRDGSALIHPHPQTTGNGQGMVNGGIAAPVIQGGPQVAPPPAAAVGPAAIAASGAAPLAGIPATANAAGDAGRSIFGGGPVGASGPLQRPPLFARKGAAIDGRAGMQVPGAPPPPDAEQDIVPAMLQPGEAVFNKKQLSGIKVKPGKGHLVRPDQKKAMRGASKRAS